MKNLIVYKGKYGATYQYAKWLSEEFELPVLRSEDCQLNEIPTGNLLILGSSVYIGKLQISRWVTQYYNQLEGWNLLLFVVSGTPLNETEKLKTYLQSSLPAPLIKRCTVFFLPGRLVYKDLSWRDRLLLRIGAMFAGSKKEKTKMLAGYDDVKIEHLAAIRLEIKKMLQDKAEQVTI